LLYISPGTEITFVFQIILSFPPKSLFILFAALLFPLFELAFLQVALGFLYVTYMFLPDAYLFLPKSFTCRLSGGDKKMRL